MAYDFVIGVYVGTYFHHACVLDPQGRQVLSKRINQHEGSLRKLFSTFLADDAYVIAHAGLNLPDALRNLDRVEEVFIQLKVLNGIDEDLARAYTRLINQMRSALVGTYPAFEHVLRGQTIHRKWILHLLAKYGGPTKIDASVAHA